VNAATARHRSDLISCSIPISFPVSYAYSHLPGRFRVEPVPMSIANVAGDLRVINYRASKLHLCGIVDARHWSPCSLSKILG